MYGNKTETDRVVREKTASCLYLHLMQGQEIPEHIRKQYGFDADYRLLEQINEMDFVQYRQERLAGKIPDVIEVDARLTRSVEKAFESVCPRPPVPYLDKLNEELEMLGGMAWSPDYKETIFYKLDFFAKYGIDVKSSREIQLRQIEKAYRELDTRFVRMTGRKPYADRLFDSVKAKELKPARKDTTGENTRFRQTGRPKGRKMGF